MNKPKYVVYNSTTGDIIAVIQPNSDIDLLMEQYPDCVYFELTTEIPRAEFRNKKVNVSTKKVVNKVPLAQFNTDNELNQNRGRRNQLLRQCDWTELPSNTQRFGALKVKEWADYRTALRDIDFANVIWPNSPE